MEMSGLHTQGRIVSPGRLARRQWRRPLACIVLMSVLVGFASAAVGEVTLTPLMVEGEVAPGAAPPGESFRIIERPNYNDAGVLFVNGNLTGNGNADHFLFHGSAVAAQEGQDAPGVFGTYNTFDEFQTRRQINASGDGVFFAGIQQDTDIGSEATMLYRYNAVTGAVTPLASSDDPVGSMPPISNSSTSNGYAGIFSDGGFGLVGDIGGVSTSSDSAIFKNGIIAAREDDPVPPELGLGAGIKWDTNFSHVSWSASGDYAFYQDTNLSSSEDKVCVLVRAGTAMLLAQEGHTLPGGTSPVDKVFETTLADDGTWAIRGELDSGEFLATETGFYMESGGVIEDPAGLLDAGSILESITAIDINNNGDLIYAGVIHNGGTPTDIREGIFFNGELLLSTAVPVDGLPYGGTMVTNVFHDAAEAFDLTNFGEVVFQGSFLDGTGSVLDGVFRFAIPEPATGLMLLVGLGLVLGRRRGA